MQANNRGRDRVVLRVSEFDRLIKEARWSNDSEAAAGLGLDPAIISRLRARKTSPAATTIDTIITRLGVPYTALFVRVEADRD